MSLKSASMTNIKRSLDKYCENYLGDIENYNIEYEGLPFDQIASKEWVRPKLIEVIPSYTRQGSSTQYSEDAGVIFQIDIFVHQSGATTSERTYEMRDHVAKYFKVGEDIELRDYVDDDSDLGTMRVRNLITSIPLPTESGGKYQRYVLAWDLSLYHVR